MTLECWVAGEKPWRNDRAGGAGREADGDNGTGEKCMKLEMERVDKEGPERVIIMRLERGFAWAS